MKNKFLILFIALFLVGSFWLIKVAQAGPNDTVSGWAYSSNVGWISFNSTNCDIDGDGNYEGLNEGNPVGSTPAPAGCPTSGAVISYGVHICSSDTDPHPSCAAIPAPRTGKFVGYAWSRGTATKLGGLGWITFNPGQLGECPSPTCEAKVDFGNGQVSGWARACAVFQSGCSGALRPSDELGGWEGWIKLRGTIQGGGAYGVWLDTTTSPNEFHDYAWGGDPNSNKEAVIGWISWNCQEGSSAGTSICGTSNYKVIYSPSNQKPSLSNLNIQSLVKCSLSPLIPPIVPYYISWTYNDPDGDNQSQYHLQVSTDSGFANLVIDVTAFQSLVPGQTGTSGVNITPSATPEINDLYIPYRGPGNNYYWRIQVQDSQGNWSDWLTGTFFDTPTNALPRPNFTVSNPNPAVGEQITFTDDSDCWDTNNIAYKCKNDTDNRYRWDFDFDPFNPGNIDCDSDVFSVCRGTVWGSYSNAGNYTVKLYIWDNSYANNHTEPGLEKGECATQRSISVGVVQPPPEWREIPPFSLDSIKNFFADISNFFKNILKVLT